MRSYILRAGYQTEGGEVLSFADLDVGTEPPRERLLGEGGVDELVRRIDADEASLPYRAEAIGDALYRWLDGAEGWLEPLLSGRSDLTLHLEADAPLARLPWELLHRAGFLCAHPHRLLTPVRRLASVAARPAAVAQNRPLRVLFMATSPEPVRPVLDFEREEARILDATRTQPIELLVEESGTLRGLKERLRDVGAEHFDVVHLSGHAGHEGDRPCFYFEDDRGDVHPVFADDLARAFETAWPRLVFLSGCRTGGTTADREDLPSLCEALVRAGAPAVLGWALPVGDAAATLAAEALYDRLGSGARVDEAVAAARRKLFEERSAHWPLLRLYADATPLGALVTPKQTPGRAKLRTREARSELIEANAQMEVCSRSAFVGRRRSIQRCLRVLQSRQGDEGHAEGVLLHGLGGLGKSSLAARLLDRMPGHQRVVCVGKLDELQLLRALYDRYPEVTARMNSDLPLKARIRSALEGPLEQAPALFIFDDFERNLDLANLAAGPHADALDVLQAVVQAIRETCSESRMIVTSRFAFALQAASQSGPFLAPEALESMRGADLRKKLAQLSHLGGESLDNAGVKARAVEIAGGNPRLLERLNRVVGSADVDLLSILAKMAAVTEEFREEIFLDWLVRQQAAACQRMLAQLAVVRLPVDRAAVDAIVEGEVEPHLARAGELGLVEVGVEPETGAPRYAVPAVVEPVLREVLSEEERSAATGRAAKWLHTAWTERTSTTEERAMEVHRLACIARCTGIAAEICATISQRWIDLSRFRDVVAMCRLTLGIVKDYRIHHALASAEAVLGQTDSAGHNYEEALRGCPADGGSQTRESTAARASILNSVALRMMYRGELQKASKLLDESISLAQSIDSLKILCTALNNKARVLQEAGDYEAAMNLLQDSLAMAKKAKAPRLVSAPLNNMASIMSRKGRLDVSVNLWQEALVAIEEEGDKKNEAVTRGNIAYALTRLGHVDEAMDSFRRVLELQEEIGDVKGQAITLNNVATILCQMVQEDQAGALWEHACSIQAQIGNIKSVATVRNNIAYAMRKSGKLQDAISQMEEAIALSELAGDLHGKYMSLINMAGMIKERGEPDRARDLCTKSVCGLASLGAWSDVVNAIGVTGDISESSADYVYAQAFWLCLHVEVPLENVCNLASKLFRLFDGTDRDHLLPRVGAAVALSIKMRGAAHAQLDQLERIGEGMLIYCARARGVPDSQFETWIAHERLRDPARFLPSLISALEALVPHDAWLFDRTKVPHSNLVS
ncbi:hypothetical protein sce6700 [Sorangium cellulosum So ce56]|uniref:CHAT domain-containing protein n=1 Tax=Sorangium cellulosum (strain So ce56) TaxID=448385 RepID=A9GSX5_SORC5|nr:tetratricopeptide repeat protein [Sorangium cellulosum]CAN96869.1 hypothetical protein sce6700 [Sorangium cellulosum So ce56]